MSGSFQSNAYQTNAFQIVRNGGVPVAPPISVPIPDNDYSYERTKAAFAKRQAETQRLNQERLALELLSSQKELEIQAIEAKRLNDLSDAFYQKTLLRLINEAEQIRLQNEAISRQLYLYRIEDEDTFVILMTLF